MWVSGKSQQCNESARNQDKQGRLKDLLLTAGWHTADLRDKRQILSVQMHSGGGKHTARRAECNMGRRREGTGKQAMQGHARTFHPT